MIEAAYETLRLPRTAGPDQVRRAYVRLVRRYPPEHFPDQFSKIHEAYRRLSLEDDFVGFLADKIATAKSPLKLAALLWGDHPYLKKTETVDLAELSQLLTAEPARPELDQLLDRIEASTIEWRK